VTDHLVLHLTGQLAVVEPPEGVTSFQLIIWQ
jgi:hypothetical protein